MFSELVYWKYLIRTAHRVAGILYDDDISLIGPMDFKLKYRGNPSRTVLRYCIPAVMSFRLFPNKVLHLIVFINYYEFTEIITH